MMLKHPERRRRVFQLLAFIVADFNSHFTAARAIPLRLGHFMPNDFSRQMIRKRAATMTTPLVPRLFRILLVFNRLLTKCLEIVGIKQSQLTRINKTLAFTSIKPPKQLLDLMLQLPLILSLPGNRLHMQFNCGLQRVDFLSV